MPYILPQPQARQTGWDQAGFATGVGIDLLLKALLAGQLGRVPQGIVAPTGDIRNMSLSGGRQFSGTADAARRLIPQDIQGFQNQVNRGILPATGLPPGLGFTPTGRTALRFQPPVTRQLEQAKLQESQEALADLPSKRAREKVEEDKLREEARRLKAQADLYEKAAKGEITFSTLPDGTVVPVLPSTTGPKVPKTDQKSARELAQEAEFGGLGTATGLPSPTDYPDGTIIRDTETGKRYRLAGGAWTPYSK